MFVGSCVSVILRFCVLLKLSDGKTIFGIVIMEAKLPEIKKMGESERG